MFHSRKINRKINNLHYRALRMVYRDENLSFENLLIKDGSVKIHDRNLQSLAIEMFKVDKGLAPTFMNDIFSSNANAHAENVSSNTRSNSRFYNHYNPKTVNYGLETLRSIGPKIWNMIPENIRNAASIKYFKAQIKKWVPLNCPCRLCKSYIPSLGYLP